MQTNYIYQTPHLTTATTEPLHLLERQILAKHQLIEQWFQDQWRLSPAPIYGSVDLRNAGFKLAPVDMNLFPAGFNNLNPDFLPLSIDAARLALQRINPEAKSILIIPESHTRNLFYWQNMRALSTILTQAGYTVQMGTLLDPVPEITLPDGTSMVLKSIANVNHRIVCADFNPDIILLNNDLSDGIPAILQSVQQPMVPPAELGWHQRLKSEHFQYYADISDEFANIIDIDPWFIAPLFRHCGQIDFMNHEGADCLSQNVSELLTAIQKKYTEYKIDCKPFVIVKADAGTYGMAVMTVRDAAEVRDLNRKQRTSMAKSKGGQPVQRVIVQEGIYTFETWGNDNAIAEPVVYLWGERVVGGFYRVHQDRGIDENLNAPGMQFEPLAFATNCQTPSDSNMHDECQNRFYAYSVIARLSMLAAAREMLAT